MKKLLFLALLLPLLTNAQNTIQGHFAPPESFTFALLYQVTPAGTNYIDQAKTNADGSWMFSLDENTEIGVYKIVYAVPIETNNFEFFYNGKESVSLTFNLNEGLTFITSEENIVWQRYTDTISKINELISHYYANEDPENPGKSEISTIFKAQQETQNNFEDTTALMMISPFVKSNRTYIPADYETANSYSSNLKKHYFDYMDFGNPLLQNTSFLNERVLAYILAMPKETNYYKQAVTDVVAAASPHDTAKIIVLGNLWQYMIQNQQPEVANYISDTYLLPLAKMYNQTYLITTLEEYNKTAIGKKASDFNFTYLENKKALKTSLYNFNPRQKTLLVFWSSGCGHCLEELPKVEKLMKQYPDIVVLAYALEDGVRNWNATITQLSSFTHTYDLQKWESPLVKTYGVTATPSYYILDTDKTILAKPEDIGGLETYFNE